MNEVSSCKQLIVTIPLGHGFCGEAGFSVVIDDPWKTGCHGTNTKHSGGAVN